MAQFRGKFASIRNDWTTPDELFREIDAEFGFTLDAAASAENKKVAAFFDKKIDAMTQDWAPHRIWLNPPYGEGYKLSQWVKKAHDEAQRGATVVMLIPARTNTNWFHDYCLGKAQVRFIRGRPKFGGAEHGLPQPLCFVIFEPKYFDIAVRRIQAALDAPDLFIEKPKPVKQEVML